MEIADNNRERERERERERAANRRFYRANPSTVGLLEETVTDGASKNRARAALRLFHALELYLSLSAVTPMPRRRLGRLWRADLSIFLRSFVRSFFHSFFLSFAKLSLEMRVSAHARSSNVPLSHEGAMERVKGGGGRRSPPIIFEVCKKRL